MTIQVSRFVEDQKIIRHSQNPSHPLVSVCLTTHRLRPGDTNKRAIESVLSQSFSDFEFIIVDDGSIDGLNSILLEYQRHDSRIVIIRHEINSGLPAIRVNEALMIAQGRFIAYMFDDDEWQPDALEHLVETALREDGDCAVYGIVDWIIHRSNGGVEHTLLGDWDFNYSLLKNHNRMANCAVLHPRSVLNICGLYDPHIILRRNCDYDLWLRMARIIPFRRCPHIVGKVISGTVHALGNNVNQDLVVSYRYLNTERDSRLRPEKINQFEVDSLNFVFDPSEAHRIRENYVIPFWQQHPLLLHESERRIILASKNHPNRLLVTKGDYSTSVDVTLGNFNRLLPDTVLPLTYMQEGSLSVINPWNYDTLILYRTIGSPSLHAQRQSQAWGKPVVYLMDDNMFKFGTGYLAEEFHYLKPSSPGLKVLTQEVKESDLVISYSPVITSDCKKYNPRVVELSTNIQEKFIIDSEPIRGGKETGRRLKYAILTGSARKEELAYLWEKFQEFTQRHADHVEFHIWGFDPSNFGDLACPVYFKEFNYSYDAYLQSLGKEKFDFVICPLFDDHESKMSKSPIKYLETTAAGAVGIYSDVNVYQAVSANVTGFKTANSPDRWLETLETSFLKTEKERFQIHTAAKSHILEQFTTESQIFDFLSAFEAAQLHQALTSRNAANGKPAIAYFFHEAMLGGATLHLMKHAVILSEYGFQPIFCFLEERPIIPEIYKFAQDHGFSIQQLKFRYYTYPRKLTQEDKQLAPAIKEWMLVHNIKFVHMVTYIPAVALAAHELRIPCLATLHNHYEAPSKELTISAEDEPLMSTIHSSSFCYADKWQSIFNVPAYCIRAPIEAFYFDQYNIRQKNRESNIPTVLISGTLQPRKGQLKAIKAIGNLRERGIFIRLVILGYDDLVIDYVEECHHVINELNLSDYVSIPGFSASPKKYYDEADYILCSSDEESMPQSILKGMASGLRVISTPVGGVKELIVDGFSGVITDGYEVEDLQAAIERAVNMSDKQWVVMLENAHFAARMSCAQDFVVNKLLGLYNLTVRENYGKVSVAYQRVPRSKIKIAALSLSYKLNRLLPIQKVKTKLSQISKLRVLLRTFRSLRGRVLELLRLIEKRENLEKRISPSFQKLREDSHIFNQDLNGYVLQPSRILNFANFQEYQYEFNRANLKSIEVAAILNHPATTGTIGIEIVSPENKIVTQSISPLAGLKAQAPIEFSFDPITKTEKGIWSIRVFVRNADVPLQIYEWKKINLSSKELVSRKGFIRFFFEDDL